MAFFIICPMISDSDIRYPISDIRSVCQDNIWYPIPELKIAIRRPVTFAHPASSHPRGNVVLQSLWPPNISKHCPFPFSIRVLMVLPSRRPPSSLPLTRSFAHRVRVGLLTYVTLSIDFLSAFTDNGYQFVMIIQQEKKVKSSPKWKKNAAE